jgi:hypothetical protein
LLQVGQQPKHAQPARPCVARVAAKLGAPRELAARDRKFFVPVRVSAFLFGRGVSDGGAIAILERKADQTKNKNSQQQLERDVAMNTFAQVVVVMLTTLGCVHYII